MINLIFILYIQTLFKYNHVFKEVKNFKNIDEFEAFMLKHSENIVDMLGGEIDRIEMKLRVSVVVYNIVEE